MVDQTQRDVQLLDHKLIFFLYIFSRTIGWLTNIFSMKAAYMTTVLECHFNKIRLAGLFFGVDGLAEENSAVVAVMAAA